MQKLDSYLNKIEKQIANAEKLNVEVSKASVSWHLDHVLKVVNQVTDNVSKSDSSEFKRSFNLPKLLVFLTGKIPRGKAKAPKSVQSFETVSQLDLKNQLETAKLSIIKLENLNANQHFKHPFFGLINLKETIYFLKIHTHHHLKIVNDIVKA